MFCRKCGQELVENALSCPKCGEKVLQPGTAIVNKKEKISNEAKIIISIICVFILLILMIGFLPDSKFRVVNDENSNVQDIQAFNDEFYNKINEYLESTSIPMITVEGGNLVMGNGFHSDIPQKSIEIKPFEICVTEITQDQWQMIAGDDNPSVFIGENNPVENISWYQAIIYCNLLSEYFGRTACYSVNGTTDTNAWIDNDYSLDNVICDFNCDGYRLPTEAEWEYAARGGNSNLYNKYCGNDDNINEAGWYFDNSNAQTHPVAQKQPNNLGLYDMCGNVSEWVWDSNGDLKRDRGGSFSSCLNWFSGLYVDCREGEGVAPEFTYKSRGFRLVRSR